jgi:hypothetical protein
MEDRPPDRPLFVPRGIPAVRTGPTTREEFERLLEGEHDPSQIRPMPIVPVRRSGLLAIVTDVLRLMFQALRPERSFESK